MDYPEAKVWRRVLFSPKMLFIISTFMMWDHYILGGALPFVASLLVGLFTTNVFWITQPYVEILALVIVVFIFIFATLRAGLESWFWRKLFLLEKSYYCVLAVRDFLNCWALITNITELVNSIYGSQRQGLRMRNLGGATWYVFLVRLVNYGVPIDASHIQSAVVHRGFCYGYEGDAIGTCFHFSDAINSAEFFVSVALLASSVARLLYINSLYSYMAAVDLLSEFDPFLQMQLRFDERNGNSMHRGHPPPFPRPDNNATSRPTAGSASQTDSSPLNSSGNAGSPPVSWGWPLSHFREDIAESFPG